MSNFYTSSENAREADMVYVLSGDKSADVSGVNYFLEGLFRIRRRSPGPFMLPSKNGNSEPFDYRLSMEPVQVPDAPIPLSKVEWYDQAEIRRYFASGQNFNPLPTDPDYTSRFEQLLARFGSSDAEALLQDLSDIESNVASPTEREILAKARIGQGKFRSDVAAEWGKGETCALTGIAVPEMLTASHVKPWRDSSDIERLDPANGLLLVAHADRLFDRYLLSFKYERGEYYVELNPRVRSAAAHLGIRTGLTLNASNLGFSAANRFDQYMRGHYARFREQLNAEKPTS
jgi:hypothetical protein